MATIAAIAYRNLAGRQDFSRPPYSVLFQLIPTPNSKRPRLSCCSSALCLAMTAVGYSGKIRMFDRKWSRLVTAAR
jgi:hypothetical protein